MRPIVLCAMIACAAPAYAGDYTFSILRPSARTGLTPVAINAKGQILLSDYNAHAPYQHSYIISNGVAHPLGEAIQLVLLRLTDNGLAVGLDAKTRDPYLADVDNGQYTRLKGVSGSSIYVSGINQKGTVVGTAASHSGQSAGYVVSAGHVTLISVPGSDAGTTTADAINDAGDIAGSYQLDHRAQLYVYAKGQYTSYTIPGAGNFISASIDAFDQVVGTYYQVDSTQSYGFHVARGMISSIHYPGTYQTTAGGFGPNGEIFGTGKFLDSQKTVGYVLRGNHFTEIDFPDAGQYGTSVTGINAAGIVTGSFFSTAGSYLGFVATCPASQAPCS